MKYRTAYFCGTCWRELAWSQIMYNDGSCPHCGHSTHGSTVNYMKREVPAAPRRFFRHGLEPMFALWAEGARKAYAAWLARRLRRLPPIDSRYPELALRLRNLESTL